MEKWFDLHMHSSYSADGEFAPENLMKKCAAAGLKAVALADHNSTRGVLYAKQAAVELGLAYFPAIEIDCIHEKHNFHLLGYGIHADAVIFREIERDVHEQEIAASDKLIELVRKMGFYFSEELVRAKAKNGVVVAEMLAEVILNDPHNNENRLLLPLRPGGARSDNPFVNFFWDFCSQGKSAYVPIRYISLAEAVYAVQKNGGVAVLAHPGANIGQNREITESVIKAGIDGIEVYSNYHDEKTKRFYAKICIEHKKIATSGSDFHGKTKPSIYLGELEHPYAHKVYGQLVQKIKERGGEMVGCLQI